MIHILLPYFEMIPSVLLCGHAQLSMLNQQGKVAYRAVPYRELTGDICGWADVVWLIRADCIMDVRLAKLWRARGKQLVYVLDDDLLHVPVSFSCGEYYNRESIKGHIAQLMELCDTFVSPSSVLLDKYGHLFKKTFRIEEPALNCRPLSRRMNAPIRIGFAGSVDRGSDIDQLLGGTIKRVHEKYGAAVEFEFFGARPQIVDELNLKWYPYCNSYAEYQQRMAELNWDIGLAPMPDTPFHACKHYNKFIEYSGYGLPGIYSDVAPYRGVIETGKTGVLCENTLDAWFSSIERLILDAVLRENISANCIALAKERFSLEHAADDLMEAIPVAQNEAALRPFVGVSFIYMMDRCSRICYAVKRHGLKTPWVVLRKIVGKTGRT